MYIESTPLLYTYLADGRENPSIIPHVFFRYMSQKMSAFNVYFFIYNSCLKQEYNTYIFFTPFLSLKKTNWMLTRIAVFESIFTALSLLSNKEAS